MKSSTKKILTGILGLSLTIAAPIQAFAAADTNWTSNSKLYEVHTWAGKAEWGHANGALNTASFFHPHGVVALPDGRLLVSDSGNHLLRTLTAEQAAAYGGLDLGEGEAGLPVGGYNDDVLAKAAFELPSGLAIDSQGNVYLADAGNNAIRKISPDGTVTTLAGNGKLGHTDGKGKEATFYSPADVSVDTNGNVYVADTLNHVIRKVSADGTVTTLNSESTRTVEYFPGAVEEAGDFLDGAIATAKFNEPSGVAVDAKGNLYVSDRGNQRIRYIDFAAGSVTTVAGGGVVATQSPYVEGDFVDGSAAESRFNAPEGLAVAPDGTVVVADSLNHAIRLIKDGKVKTLAGIGSEYGQTDGVPASAQFNHPTDVALLADGRLAVADEFGNKVRVLQKYAKPAGLPADKTITVLVYGKPVQSEVPAQMKSNSIFLPVRSLAEAMGFTVTNDNKTGEAILTKGDLVYTIKNGSKTVLKSVKGENSILSLNGAAYVKNNRLFMPVRFFAEQDDFDIQWDAKENIVVIRTKTF